MKNEFDEGMEQFSSFCQNKLQKEVGQLDPEKRTDEIQQEEQRRISLNGGKPLDYVLMPRRISREPSI